MGEGVLYKFIFAEFLFKTVSGDVTAFHKIKPDSESDNVRVVLKQSDI